jgi:hypothetical protein
MPERRSVSFSSLEEVVSDVEKLLTGHATVGEWSLGQILYHLATAIRLSRRGRPDPVSPPVSESLRHDFFYSHRFPEGMQAPHPRLLPPHDADARVQFEELRNAIVHWTKASGPFPAHPLLGAMNKDEWTEFHYIHCAHHLSFAIPRSLS